VSQRAESGERRGYNSLLYLYADDKGRGGIKSKGVYVRCSWYMIDRYGNEEGEGVEVSGKSGKEG
jgi:hypothetical protein